MGSSSDLLGASRKTLGRSSDLLGMGSSSDLLGASRNLGRSSDRLGASSLLSFALAVFFEVWIAVDPIAKSKSIVNPFIKYYKVSRPVSLL